MNEVLSLKGYIGAFLILSGVILAEIKVKRKSTFKAKKERDGMHRLVVLILISIYYNFFIENKILVQVSFYN